tara:strand:- start:12 stop:197 length:186 start_codon:yes stop_codon:yes gene_type:complete
MELVDMPDLGSGAARRGGSSPFSRTEKMQAEMLAFFLCKLLPSHYSNSLKFFQSFYSPFLH